MAVVYHILYMSMAPMVSVIILNWNRLQDTSELLERLRRQTFKDFETVVVDNASSDNSAPLLKRNFPYVEVVGTDKNLGLFAKNCGMEKARGEYLVLLDSDVLIGDECVEKFFQKLKNNKKLGLACASIYDQKTNKYLGPNRAINGNNNEGHEVCFFNGSAVALRREVFEKVGGYSQEYFICLEELEWAARIREAGFDIRCFTDIMVYNKKTQVGGSYRYRQGFYYCRNWIWFYLQFLPLREIPRFFLLHLRSFRRKTGPGGLWSKRDCWFGVAKGILGAPRFLLRRRPVGLQTLQGIKADLFPNDKHLYVE